MDEVDVQTHLMDSTRGMSGPGAQLGCASVACTREVYVAVRSDLNPAAVNSGRAAGDRAGVRKGTVAPGAGGRGEGSRSRQAWAWQPGG